MYQYFPITIKKLLECENRYNGKEYPVRSSYVHAEQDMVVDAGNFSIQHQMCLSL